MDLLKSTTWDAKLSSKLMVFVVAYIKHVVVIYNLAMELVNLKVKANYILE
jgi:hypothetical protein